MEYLIKTYTNEYETVLDFTMGSGSTGVAAKNLNRNFIGIEQDQQYFEIATERINYIQRQTKLL
jgi:site-specific DNA-methyltransferase (adenine-specific)